MASAAEHLTGPLPRHRRAWQGVKAIANRGPGTPVRIDEVDTIPIQNFIARVAEPGMLPPRPPRTPAPTTAVVTPVNPMALIARVQAGDSAAFGEFYDHYLPTVYKFINFRVGNRQVVEDLTADTFLRALKSIGNFRWQGRDPGAWLVRIARNLVADYYKSGRCRFEVTTGDVLDDDRADSTPDGDPQRVAVDRDTSRILLAAIRKLTPEQQDVIVLRFLHGFSPTETAQAIGKGEKVVNARLYRALRTLRRLLPNGFGP